MNTTSKRFTWAPIRKVAVGLITYAIVLGARKALHLDLGSDTVADVVNGAIGFGAAYAVKDPRVRSVAEELERSALAAEIEAAVLSKIEGRLPGA